MESRDEIVYWAAAMLRHFAVLVDRGVSLTVEEVREHCLAEDLFEWLHLADPTTLMPRRPPSAVEMVFNGWLSIDAGDDTGGSFGIRTNGLLLVSVYLAHNLGRFAQGTR